MFSGGLSVGDARRTLCTAKNESRGRDGGGDDLSDDGEREVENAKLTYHKDDG